MEKISIIVPVYNMEKYLEKSLKSFVNQTFSDIEIVIVDDGSTDNSSTIYNRFAEADSRIKIVKKVNAGVSEARNTGIDNAKGEFLMFADPDDWMEPRCCEILYNEQNRTQADMVLADVIVIKNDMPEQYKIFEKSFTTSEPQFIKQYQKACIGYCYNPMPSGKWKVPGLGSPWNKLFKKSIIDEHHLRFDPYVKGIYDDNLFTLHYLMHVKKLSYIQEPVYNYLILSTSITNSYKKNTLDINERIFKRINDFIDETGDRAFFEEALYINIMRRLTRSTDVYFFSGNNPKSLSGRCRELRETFKTEPYKTAIHKVKLNQLIINDRIVALFAKMNAPGLVWLGVKAMRFLGKRKQRTPR